MSDFRFHLTCSVRLTMISFVLVTIILSKANGSDEITETRFLMGTFVSITLDAESTRQNYARVLDDAFSEIKRLENALSTFIPDSDISKLNRESKLVGKHPELREIILRALHYSSLSDGLFDITIKPVLDLYRRSFSSKGREPATADLERALSLVDHRNVILDEKSIRLVGHGIQITTDGIAKGYIIDQTVDLLLTNGVSRALVNIGGDLRALGNNWNVALQNPRDVNEYIVTISLKNEALATSGDYERYFDPNKKAHHILNPKTGQSATDLISATIIADNAADADALATTVFVMGTHDGMELIERLNEVEGLLITRKRGVIVSTGFKWQSQDDNVEIARNPLIDVIPMQSVQKIK